MSLLIPVGDRIVHVPDGVVALDDTVDVGVLQQSDQHVQVDVLGLLPARQLLRDLGCSPAAAQQW